MKSISNAFSCELSKCHSRMLVIALAGLLLISTSACTTAVGPDQKVDSSDESKVQTVWPVPPEEPRIRYVRTLKYLEDVTGKQQQSLRDRLLGKEQDSDLLFKKPLGVHSDGQGRVYVADTGLLGLVVIDLEQGKVVSWGETGPGQLNKAVAVTSDARKNVYVSDNIDKRIVIFDRDGNFISAMGGKALLGAPAGLVFDDRSQQLYVVDVKHHHIKVFNQQGKVLFTIGERGQKAGQFNYPTNIAMDTDGQYLYVADTLNFRVQVFKPDGSFVTSFGKNGNGPGDFTRLKGIGVDSDNNIYAVDAAFNNFQILDQQGQLLLFVGRNGVGPDGFYLPAGAHVDSNNQILIADQYNQRIQIFEYLGSLNE